MPSWQPLYDGAEVPNGSDVRPDGGGAGGFEFSPNDVGVGPCANPIARFVNNQLTFECRVITCQTSCEESRSYDDPTNPEQFKTYCVCAEL